MINIVHLLTWCSNNFLLTATGVDRRRRAIFRELPHSMLLKLLHSVSKRKAEKRERTASAVASLNLRANRGQEGARSRLDQGLSSLHSAADAGAPARTNISFVSLQAHVHIISTAGLRQRQRHPIRQSEHKICPPPQCALRCIDSKEPLQ